MTKRSWQSVPGGVEGARTTCLWDEQSVDGHPMIAAEDDHEPLQRAHRDGSSSPVSNHEDIYTSTGTTCR